MLFFNAIMFAFIEVPLIGYLISPDATRTRVRAFRAWLGDHARHLATLAAAVIGVYLLVKGIAHLHQPAAPAARR